MDELYKTSEQLPEVDRHEVYAHHVEEDEWEEVPYRDSLWTDDMRATGVVSSSKDFYNIIQYGEILETVGEAIEQNGLDVEGTVSLSPTAHKMNASIEFEGNTVYANRDDPVTLGLQVQSGHSGYHRLKYDVGAERLVCSNGMTAFISELSFDQTHQDPFQPRLAYNAVDAVATSPEMVERRLEKAQEHVLMNQDEALLVLLETGIDSYLEQPVPDLLNALHDEVKDPENPSLWETYNAATRALTHYTENTPRYELSKGYENAAKLLENGDNQIPEPEILGSQAVEDRTRQLIEQDDTEPYWEDEPDALRQLRELHEIQA
ncbi:DUF932 domain-containing protein [Haloarchaeobius amylolyticus]|uniref:DUF932 domain-containing protein n=1 Tax=Haloarchaeobius amylolyticus TaxID=1198296 RepID=A0ABD6BCM2_9EURY